MQKKQVTIKEFASMIDEDYIVASALMKLLEKMEAAVPVGTRKTEGQRGKPSLIYEIDQEVVLEFWQDKPEENVVTAPEAATLSIPEVAPEKLATPEAAVS